MIRQSTRQLFVAGVLAIVGTHASAQVDVLSVDLIAAEGQEANGSNGFLINSVNAPFTDGNGVVGFTGNVDVPDDGLIWFVWYDDGITFLAEGNEVEMLSGGESTMGVGNNGEFIYSPSVNGEDAVYTNNGLLLRATDMAPGLPGLFSSFNSRPRMSPDGTAYWIGGTTDTMDGSTQGRVLYKAEDAGLGAITPVLATGDMIDGFEIQASSGVDFDYELSDNNLHHIHFLDTVGDSDTDGFIYVDGSLVAREGDPNGSGDNWDNFDTVSINDNGDYIFTGDTDGLTDSDEFIAYNGTIVVREGDTLDGVLIESGSSIRAASINNLGQVAHSWGSGFGGSAVENLFFGNGANLGSSSVRLLGLHDLIDVDGDEVADWEVFDLEASTVIGPGLDLAEDGFLFVEVGLGAIGNEEEFTAIIRLTLPPDPIAIVSSDPSDGTIDARQPHEPGEFDNVQGFSEITLTFNVDPADLTANDFSVSVDGSDDTVAIASVTPLNETDLLVTFDGVIPVGAWTMVTHTDSGTSTRIGYLPADVSGDGTSAVSDVLTLIDALNNQIVLPETSTDIDRSGVSTAADVLREIDLLNGAGFAEAFLGMTLPA